MLRIRSAAAVDTVAAAPHTSTTLTALHAEPATSAHTTHTSPHTHPITRRPSPRTRCGQNDGGRQPAPIHL